MISNIIRMEPEQDADLMRHQAAKEKKSIANHEGLEVNNNHNVLTP